MNHSPAFWALVQQLYGDYRPPRQWLRQHGAGLHSYRFVD
jgi:predicted metal-dependent hydrolase